MKKILYLSIGVVCILAMMAGLQLRPKSHEQMIELLDKMKHRSRDYRNDFSPEAQLAHLDSMTRQFAPSEKELYMKANILLKLGQEEKAIPLLEMVYNRLAITNPRASQVAMGELALAYLRLGEQVNCRTNHSAESCILPIQGRGIHTVQTGSKKAIELYETLLKQNPGDIESRWLLNLAYMTVGKYPNDVPKAWLIPNMVDTSVRVNAFQDIAQPLKLDVNNMAGGTIVEDFDLDGYLDIALSAWGLDEPMHYFRNNGDGTFSDQSAQSGLSQISGGLNMVQTDYNNDGYPDIFVLPGGLAGRVRRAA